MDKDDKVVLEITKSGPKPSGQDKKYKDQIISFPELYKTGNFSILMKNVQESDSGPYDCVINSVNFEQRVYLNVSGLYFIVYFIHLYYMMDWAGRIMNLLTMNLFVCVHVAGERVRETETYSGSSGVAAVTPNSLRIILLSLPLSLLFSCSKICRWFNLEVSFYQDMFAN